MNDLVYIGYLSMPFGLKGEIKLLSDENHLDKIIKVNQVCTINKKEYIIKNVRYFKNHYFIVFDGYDDINLIDNIIKNDLYISRNNIILKDDEYLYSDLLNCMIYDNDEKIGFVDDILINKKYTYIKSANLIIPLIDKYIIKVDIIKKIIYCKNVGELRL